EILRCLVGSEMCIRDRNRPRQPKKLSGNFITITAGYQHNDIHCEVFLSGQLMCFLQAAGSQQLQLIPKIRETCCGKYICNNVCFGMATFKPNEFEFDS
ncbi:hypothetical protein MU456_13670, partial [Staphylococcus aureus]|nr:hypothetical protein [Staphylococcus aureus]